MWCERGEQAAVLVVGREEVDAAPPCRCPERCRIASVLVHLADAPLEHDVDRVLARREPGQPERVAQRACPAGRSR